MGCGPGGYWVELKELKGTRVWVRFCGLAQVGLGLNENKKNRRKKKNMWEMEKGIRREERWASSSYYIKTF